MNKTKKFILGTQADPIRATMTSDDDAYVVRFDASDWFEHASEEDVRALAGVGWMRDYEADVVAKHFDRPQNPTMREAFRHIRGGRVGFEVEVNDRDALEWLKKFRPEWYENIVGEFGTPLSSDTDWTSWRQTE
jgi:hypothetical protein